MTEELNDKYIDGNIPEPYQYVQAMLDRFVAISYNAAYDALHLYSGDSNTEYLREQIIGILRDNPPLATIPNYLRDGRVNFLWYSDFYDDAGKDIFRLYGRFVAPTVKITPANYATELAKIDLPYFKELVNLISLEKLYQESVENQPAPEDDTVSINTDEQPEEATIKEIQPEQPVEESKPKRSYEPKMNKEQYSLLVECIEKLKLFRSPVKITKLKRLLKGKLEEPLQVTNQNSLTYLLDELGKCGCIKLKWTAIAVGNKDFLSFRRGKNVDRYGDEPHYIPLQQFSNCRASNETTGLKDAEAIEVYIEKIRECGDR